MAYSGCAIGNCMAALDYNALRAQTLFSSLEEEAVTVNTRALVLCLPSISCPFPNRFEENHRLIRSLPGTLVSIQRFENYYRMQQMRTPPPWRFDCSLCQPTLGLLLLRGRAWSKRTLYNPDPIVTVMLIVLWKETRRSY